MMDELLAKIDHTLSQWENIKGVYGLTPELIEEGKRILAEGK